MKLLYYNLKFLFNLFIYRFILHKEYIGWNIRKKMIKDIDKEYDLSVGFLEKQCTYFTLDKTKSNKKVGWVHTDYKSIEIDYDFEKLYLSNLDTIVTVSEHSRESLIELFPELEKKLIVIENIVSPNIIKSLANEEIESNIEYKNNETLITTVCRLTKAKGLDIAVEACEKLIEKGYKVKWIVVGEGAERENLQNLIKQKKLEETFILLGSKKNPYPYIKKCDIYVQPSRFEGFGITVLEAKILNKPIVVSDIPEFREQIEHEINGLIYDGIDEFVFNVAKLIDNDNLKNSLRENLSTLNLDNSDELKKLINLI